MLSESTCEGGAAELKSRPSSCGLHPNVFSISSVFRFDFLFCIVCLFLTGNQHFIAACGTDTMRAW